MGNERIESPRVLLEPLAEIREYSNGPDGGPFR